MHNPGRGYHNEFRIIAGEWRHRRLRFPELPDIRPSPDRVRETLFNWLRNALSRARCLDLFAGSGALGLEALSRGADSVLFVDRERRVIAALQAHLTALQASGGATRESEALKFLGGTPQAFDIVFLDPPFGSELLGKAVSALRQPGWLTPSAHVYMEYPKGSAPALPDDWKVIRQGRAGQVGFGLVRRVPAQLASN